MKLAESVKAKKIFFSLKESGNRAAFYDPPNIILRIGDREESYSLAKAPLKGVHNVENMMAAITASRLFRLLRSQPLKRS